MPIRAARGELDLAPAPRSGGAFLFCRSSNVCFQGEFCCKTIWQAGVFVVPVEVTCAMAQALVDQDDVDEANSSDLDCVGEAIAAAARRELDLT